jgi:nitroimidazol reductase NimA-like FMN-containing flavoprotein (pyridoxamine 5'-phosphate oxidase superfamily)
VGIRRKDREISGIEEQLAVIKKYKVCRLGMSEDRRPYIVPLNYGYEYTDQGLVLYFHSAHEGRKMDILKKNPQVCFEIDGEHALIAGEAACEYGYAYESLIGFGVVEFLAGDGEKARGLNCLMRHQTGMDRDFVFDEGHLRGVEVYALKVRALSGKRRAAGAPVSRSASNTLYMGSETISDTTQI